MSYKRYIKTISDEVISDLSGFGNPVVLIILLVLLFGFSYNALTILVGMIAVEILSNGVKLFYFKERPVKKKHDNFPEKIYAASFPSIHTARSSFFFFSLYSLSIFPVNVLALIAVVFVAISRLLLKKHFIMDVIVGLTIGYLVFLGWLWAF